MASLVKKIEEQEETVKGLVDRVHEQILFMIQNKEMKPNQIVRERRLAEQLNVSRTPLREALNRLEGSRWLTRSEDGVLSVTSINLDELMEVLQVRKLLETEAARLAAGHLDKDIASALRSRLTGLVKQERLTQAEDDAFNDEFHAAIADACGNHTLARLLSDMRKLTRISSIRNWPNRLSKVSQEHLTILDAIVDGDPDAAVVAMRAHIESARMHILNSLGRSQRR